MSSPRYDVVIPTIGRASLATLVASLRDAEGPLPDRIVIVDDRSDRSDPIRFDRDAFPEIFDRIDVIAGFAAGPAAARNRGWRRATAPWIAFLDDDVIVERTWLRDLARDLAECGESCAGSQGNVSVPLDPARAPTDWERNVRALEDAHFITADFAFRRSALEETRGFDERFPRAYREDAEFAMRLMQAGWTLAVGERRVRHPVGPADFWVSVRLQAGNADDVLIAALYGDDWTERARATRGRFREHFVTVCLVFTAAAAIIAVVARIARFALERIRPGPRDAREIVKMAVTSAIIPLAAVYHRSSGMLRLRGLLQRPAQRAAGVLFDRDGTLLVDDPDLRDPDAIQFIGGAESALARLRDAGIAYGIVTNQPRVGNGTLRRAELDAIHARMDAEVGPFSAIAVCEHTAQAGCVCRKPSPGLIFAATKTIGISPAECVVIGDIGSDVEAARAAGARSILVPTRQTLRPEIKAAHHVARDLHEAVDLILGGYV